MVPAIVAGLLVPVIPICSLQARGISKLLYVLYTFKVYATEKLAKFSFAQRDLSPLAFDLSPYQVKGIYPSVWMGHSKSQSFPTYISVREN
jgi:hypothetical protein